MKIPGADEKAYEILFGNRNSDFYLENGLLVSTFADDAGGDTPPLIITYKWNTKEFVTAQSKKTGVVKTSYDCAKADSEAENAIGHVKELADLDITVGVDLHICRGNFVRYGPGCAHDRARWIAKRDKECPIHKGWGECLSDCHQKRIAELKRRSVPAAVVPQE